MSEQNPSSLVKKAAGVALAIGATGVGMNALANHVSPDNDTNGTPAALLADASAEAPPASASPTVPEEIPDLEVPSTISTATPASEAAPSATTAATPSEVTTTLAPSPPSGSEILIPPANVEKPAYEVAAHQMANREVGDQPFVMQAHVTVKKGALIYSGPHESMNPAEADQEYMVQEPEQYKDEMNNEIWMCFNSAAGNLICSKDFDNMINNTDGLDGTGPRPFDPSSAGIRTATIEKVLDDGRAEAEGRIVAGQVESF